MTEQRQQAPGVSVWTDVRPEPGETGGRRRYAELLEEARLIDGLGYQTLCTTEQHAVDDGYLPAQLTLISALGQATTQVRFMTNALLLLLHQGRHVAEQAVIADLMTDGRLSLGVAAGGYQREFDLFGVDMKQRAKLMEEALPFLRNGLATGELPDGPGGSMLPLLPRPVQERIPVYLGGNAMPVFDRAARLADGATPVDFFAPDEEFPNIWETKLQPAMQKHGRTLDDFRFIACVPIWASDDPERDWETFFHKALDYQFGKYAEWAGDIAKVGVDVDDSESIMNRTSMLVDTPENVAKRLLAIRERAPFHEVVFWYRIPHIGHERAMEHLELVANRVMPLLQGESS